MSNARHNIAAAAIFWLLLAVPTVAAQGDHQVQVSDPALWSPLLSTIGVEATAESARFRIVVGSDPFAVKNGFAAMDQEVRVASVVDSHDPELDIYWQEPTPLPKFVIPAAAKVFARERHTGAPLLAGISTDDGGLLWLATPPGDAGYERFPYLLHALVDIGFKPPFRGNRLWAFFDSSYRLRADPDYLARQWRNSGIMGIHVAAWHYYDPDQTKADYLKKLMDACRREGVLVYAWLEMPHVSEGFWQDNPQCREKTASLQDAKLDWRKLIDLIEPKCAAAVLAGTRRLLTAFEWDGINLGELYFESLHGPDNPARFTPMSDSVRKEATPLVGFDPLELLTLGGPRHWSKEPKAWQAFVDYRAELALRLQEDWLKIIRETLPETDIVVTQIDDQFDPRMRELLGTDAAKLLPLAEQYDFTLLVEDPAPLWALGPERYPEISRRYQPLTSSPERLAIDINIVERYQQTYPTRKQTGVELLQLVDRSSRSFPRVALYFENSISKVDRPLLPRSASAAGLISSTPESAVVSGMRPFGVSWSGFAKVDGKIWPLGDAETVWLPAGQHQVEHAATPPPGRVLHLTGDLESARVVDSTVELTYRSSARAIALLDRRPTQVAIDGAVIEADLVPAKRHWSLRLPRGRHEIALYF
jgi:hypothetical protein